eukprot:gene4387-4971_t
MNYVKGLVSNVKGFYDGINAATLTGAIDVIVIRQEDGSLIGSPFHVRFGKLGVLRAKEKIVDISVNNKDVDLHMKLGYAGEAFFVQECQEENVPVELATSPIPSNETLFENGMQELHAQDKNHDSKLDEQGTKVSVDKTNCQDKGSEDTGLENVPVGVEIESTARQIEVSKRKDSDVSSTVSNSPAKVSGNGHASSSSIPIPSGNFPLGRRGITLSDSEDQASCSPYVGDDLFLANMREYPLSDMDLEISTVEHEIDPRKVLSDTELELSSLQISDNVKSDDVTWEWGELPQGPAKVEKIIQQDSLKKKRIEKGVKSRPKSCEGLYLDDVLLADEEVAAVYFNRQAITLEGDFDSDIGHDSKPVSPIEANCELSQRGFPKKIAMSLCGDLRRGKVDPDKFKDALVSYDEFCKNPGILNDPKLVVKMDKKYYNWQVAAPYVMSMAVFQKPLCRNTLVSLKQQHMPRKESSDEDDTVNISKKHERHHRQRQPKQEFDVAQNNNDMNIETRIRTKDRYKKVTRLSSNQWESLGLCEGTNDVTFSVTTQYQGTASCSARIFLWNYYDKIVISDIDGTITKSDVIGQILPLVGRDWSQSGVTGLFTNVEKNGYKFMYLSARAIGQAQITRDFLKSVRQGEKTLPDGPVLLSPTSLVKAFQREVIEKKPEIFKIACMKDIKNIFPSTRNPFFSGFGNKINDVWAYRALGIPISRIFTINYKGEIKHELTNAFSSSYDKLVNLVDQMFPPLMPDKQVEEIVSPDFSTFIYWKHPFPDVSIDMSDPDEDNVGL